MVFTGPGKPLLESTFPLPQLQQGELLVKIRYCSICASDLHTFYGRRKSPAPLVPGHEIVGEVFQTCDGEQRTDYTGEKVTKGDLITWSLAVSCGKCQFCKKGFPQKCENLLKYGHQKQKLEDEHPNFPFELLFHQKYFSLKDTEKALEMAENNKVHRAIIAP